MVTDFSRMDLFCRINVQSEKTFQEFVEFVARCVGGTNHLNDVRSKTLDISVFENDDFDAKLSNMGDDRWLHFRYTLEIDPIEDVVVGDYVAAIAVLLQALWSSCLDAVACCDFENQLPQNVRRLKWAKGHQSDKEGAA